MYEMPSQQEKISTFKEKLEGIKRSLVNIKEKMTPDHPAFDKFINLADKTTTWIKRLAVIGSIVSVANYHASHDELQITEKDGKKEYHHPDEQTNHYLNILAGKEKITEEDIVFEMRQFIKLHIAAGGYKVDFSVDDMNIDDIDNFAVEYLDAQSGELKSDLRKTLENMQEIDSSNPIHEKTYDMVWNMEQECGNPKIRLNVESFTPIFGFPVGIGNPHYNSLTNTVFLGLYDFVGSKPNSFHGELAHAKQFNDDQVGSYWRAIRDGVFILANSDFDISKIYDIHGDTYHTVGHIEHEAHAIIEPYLEKKYPLRNHLKKDDTKK